MKKISRLIACLLFVFALGACMTACKDKTIHVDSVTLDRTELTLKVGESATLNVTVAPGDAENKNVQWSSSDPSVATVDGGVVKAIGAGNATVTVKSVDADKTATCRVVVEALSIYEEMMQLSEKEHDKAVLTIGTKLDGDELVDRYEVEKKSSGYRVTFTQENFAKIEFDANGNVTLPESGKKVLSGSIDYDSKWHETGHSGDEVSISIGTITLKYDFSEKNLDGAEKSENVFTASVKDVEGFIGHRVDCTGMKVTATIEDNTLKSVSVTYTSAEGASVEINIEYEG